MIKKIVLASVIVSSVVVGSAFAESTGETMMKKDDAMMMKKDDAMMMKKTVAVSATTAEVTELQEVLIEKGYLVLPAGVSKGNFGKLTKMALIKYQKASGLNPAGHFGALTKAKIKESKSMMMKKEEGAMMKKDDAMMMKKEI
jgi:peptidoglycan hydrolase-like protein with peptidoglycan-binding domain